jgi:hypothetical protein
MIAARRLNPTFEQLPRHGHLDEFVAAGRVVVVADGVGEAGGMRQQLMQRDGLLVRRHILEILRDRIADAQLSLFFEGEDRRSGELLRDRADGRSGVDGVGALRLRVGEAVRLLQDDVAVLADDDRAGEAEALQARHEVIDPLRGVAADDDLVEVAAEERQREKRE